jgi:hypothetical protein
MNKAPILAFAAVAFSLSACNHKPEEVDNKAPDPIAEQIKNAAPVELPPAIAATVTFRCQPGNTLLYADFFQGEKMVVIKQTKDGAPQALKAPEAGQPYVAEGTSWKVTGTSKSATIVLPDGSSHTCKS